MKNVLKMSVIKYGLVVVGAVVLMTISITIKTYIFILQKKL
jgi:hypothetical protein